MADVELVNSIVKKLRANSKKHGIDNVSDKAVFQLVDIIIDYHPSNQEELMSAAKSRLNVWCGD